ncbi:response regulator [Vallitalea pronyensis]|uniref:Stage 0 sporulation protein A homolog n=1 Tax=Vallitalea pronyensis TaxID=1348613 RepID=A0A8J8MNV7_9FIRM|nr:response regulator [Vallitalea pronyensis]QUI25265.1 response regulator [Vallitalea pronyensis]
MLRLLIVDDEKQIREGLGNTINWKDVGIEHVYTAANGYEAFKVVCDKKPHIIITDIRMPVMDGLELCQLVKEAYPSIKIILLSGYSDFSYAKQGIVIGVNNYFTKPVNIETLLVFVQTLVSDIKREQIEKNTFKQKIFTYLSMNEEQESTAILNQLCLQENIPRHKNRLFCIMVEFDQYENLETDYDKATRLSIKRTIKKVVCETFTEPMHSFHFSSQQDNQLAFYVFCNTYDHVQAFKDEVTHRVEEIRSLVEQEQLSLTFGISKTYSKFNFQKAFLDAKDCLAYKFFMGYGKLIFSESMDQDPFKTHKKITLNHDDIAQGIKALSYEKLIQGVQSLFDAIRTASDADEVKGFLTYLIGAIGNEMKTIYKQMHIIDDMVEGYCSKIKQSETIMDCFNIVETFCIDGLEKSNHNLIHSNNNLIGIALDYMHKNYRDHISIETVSHYIDRNANYFCHLFKKETGVSIQDYINAIRIKQSKQLLKNTSLMAYEIADQVGFSSYKYYYNCFKKNVGLTPTQYRNKTFHADTKYI